MAEFFLSDIGEGLITGLIFGGWIVGTLLVVFSVLNSVGERWRQYTRNGRFRGFVTKIPIGNGGLRDIPFIKHLHDEIEISEFKVTVETVLLAMIFLTICGYFSANGAITLMQQKFALDAEKGVANSSWVLSVVIGLFIGSLPYFFIRFRVHKKRTLIAKKMIETVQNLIGHYRSSLTTAQIISNASGTMPDEILSEWKRLELMVHISPLEESLYEFARRINNHWADDLVDTLLTGSFYGIDISEALHKLVKNMQTAYRNEKKRIAMVTVYRIGTSIMAGVSFFVVYMNVRADPENFGNYFLNPVGQTIIIFSFIVMFVAMIFVIKSGEKQI